MRTPTTTRRPFRGTRTPACSGGASRSTSAYLGREDAKRAGLAQRAFREYARVSFAKVAEYQKRGAVHSHAVIRSDGPEGCDTPLPVWATAELLTDATRAAAAPRVDGPVIDGRVHTLAPGRRPDVRTMRSAGFNDGQEPVALGEAVRRGHVVMNAAEIAKAPRLEGEDIEPCTIEEVESLLVEAAELRSSVRWAVALALGLRQGEALGPHWEDVDLDAGYVRVRRNRLRPEYAHGCGAKPCDRKADYCPERGADPA